MKKSPLQKIEDTGRRAVKTTRQAAARAAHAVEAALREPAPPMSKARIAAVHQQARALQKPPLPVLRCRDGKAYELPAEYFFPAYGEAGLWAVKCHGDGTPWSARFSAAGRGPATGAWSSRTAGFPGRSCTSACGWRRFPVASLTY